MDSFLWLSKQLAELAPLLLSAVLSLALLGSLAVGFVALWHWRMPGALSLRGAENDERRNRRLALLCGCLGALCGVGFGLSGLLLLLDRPGTPDWVDFDTMEGIGALGATAGWALAWLMCGFAIPEER